MASYKNLRIAAAVGERMNPYALALEWTPNKFAECCVAAILEMIEQPADKRAVPKLVAMADAAKASKVTPMFLPGAKYTAMVEHARELRAAEDHPAGGPEKKRKRA